MNAVHGLLLELKGPDELLEAAVNARQTGLAPLDAFSPFPIEELSEALGIPSSRIPWVMLCGGITGAVLAFATMTFSAVWHYPFNVGGRPHFSWPAFVPITFELTILFAALSGAFSLAIFTKLPCLHHPVFNDTRFRNSMQGGYFLLLPDSSAARAFLEEHFPNSWKEVEE